MKLRDELNNREGYQEIIEFYTSSINEYEQEIELLLEYEKKGIQKYSNPNLEIIKSTKEELRNAYYKILKSMYSKGDTIEGILAIYLKLISYFTETWKKSNGYVQMLEMLSIGIMLKIGDKDFKLLIEAVKKDDPQDLLIDTLISYRDENWKQLSGKLMWNKPYKALQEVIFLAKEDKNLSLERLHKYLKKEWFRGAVEIQTHKSKFNIHSGYWSFESGALVKILELDDAILKDQQYYPYDMVHYKE